MARDGKRQQPDVTDDAELFKGVDGEADEAGRRRLLEHLVEAGADGEKLRSAAREGRLATLPVEYALKGEARYTLTEVAREAHLDPGYLRSVLLSLGHA